MKRGLVILATFALVGAACTGDGGGDSGASASDGGGGDPTEITMWHGYGNLQTPNGQVNYEAKSLTDLVNTFNETHPDIVVAPVFTAVNDNILQKLVVGLQGGLQPDIAYQYGTSIPQLATAPGIIDLTSTVQEPGWNWDDFLPGEREAAMTDGKVYGVPALVDNLAIVYNKDLFDAAGLDYPTAEWTWDDFRAAAKALTDPSKKQFGFGFPADATEDTVWHYDAMLWEANGDILNADNTQAAFNSQAGVTALTTLQQMAITDKSMYLDQSNTKLGPLMNSGKLGMLVTGPWALSEFPDIDYGVQIMPTYPGGSHTTIAGPDMWVVFDNGADRSAAALTFLKWFTAAKQIETNSMTTGDLPTRDSVVQQPGFLKSFGDKFPGADAFAENLANVTKARPSIAQYDEISQVMGQAIVSVLLGQAEPQAALDDAAEQVNQILSGP